MRARRALAVGAALAAAAIAPATASAAVQITATPALSPGFSETVGDYAVRCVAGQPVELAVQTTAGEHVTVEGQPWLTGSFTRLVDLEPGQATKILVRSGTTTRTHHVRCLSTDFPAWSAVRSGETQAEWYVVTPTGSRHTAVFDSFGAPVWWLRTDRAVIDASLLPNGNMSVARYISGPFGKTADDAYDEFRLDGSLAATWKTIGSPTDFHDIRPLSNGNRLMLTYRPRDGVDLTPYGGPANATVLDAEVQEVTPQGTVAWSWNSKDRIALEETGRWWSHVIANPSTLPDGRTAYDQVHPNSIDDIGGDVVMSARHTDAIYRIRRSNGAIAWKLGGTTTAQSLAMQGHPDTASANFGGQHDARALGNGSVSLYDNGANRGRPPRALRYTLDLTARTATLAETITDPGATTTLCCGSARRMAGGNWVVGWEANSLFTETTAAGNRRFALSFGDGRFTYRAVPVPFGTLSRTALRAGMDARAPGGRIEADRYEIDFGEVPAGTSPPTTEKTVLVKNRGPNAVTVRSAGITGANAGEFGFAYSTCTASSAPLAPGDFCTLRVQFAPTTAAGARAGYLVLRSTGSPSPLVIPMSGSVAAGGTSGSTDSTSGKAADGGSTEAAAQSVLTSSTDCRPLRRGSGRSRVVVRCAVVSDRRGGRLRARLLRKRKLYATGIARVRRGRATVVLRPRRHLRGRRLRGTYTLELKLRQGRRTTILAERVRLR